MTFPFSFSSHVDLLLSKGLEPDLKYIRRKIEEGLISGKGTIIISEGEKINFKGGFLTLGRFFLVNKGLLRIQILKNFCRISYKIYFIEILALISLITLVFIGIPLFLAENASLGTNFFIVFFSWFTLFGTVYLVSAFRFANYLRRLLLS